MVSYRKLVFLRKKYVWEPCNCILLRMGWRNLPHSFSASLTYTVFFHSSWMSKTFLLVISSEIKYYTPFYRYFEFALGKIIYWRRAYGCFFRARVTRCSLTIRINWFSQAFSVPCSKKRQLNDSRTFVVYKLPWWASGKKRWCIAIKPFQRNHGF